MVFACIKRWVAGVKCSYVSELVDGDFRMRSGNPCEVVKMIRVMTFKSS